MIGTTRRDFTRSNEKKPKYLLNYLLFQIMRIFKNVFRVCRLNRLKEILSLLFQNKPVPWGLIKAGRQIE